MKLYPIKRQTTKAALNKLVDQYIPEMGKPKRLLADNGTSPVWATELRKAGIQALYSTVRHPQSNPTERVMRELGRLFRILCSDKLTRWARHISDIDFFLNVTTHFSTGFTPIELHFERKVKEQVMNLITFPILKDISHEAKIFLAREKILANYEKRKRAQGRFSTVLFKVGDLVMVDETKQSDAIKKLTHKFFHLFYGPYRISRVFGNNSYEFVNVDDPNVVKGRYIRCSLKRHSKR